MWFPRGPIGQALLTQVLDFIELHEVERREAHGGGSRMAADVNAVVHNGRCEEEVPYHLVFPELAVRQQEGAASSQVVGVDGRQANAADDSRQAAAPFVPEAGDLAVRAVKEHVADGVLRSLSARRWWLWRLAVQTVGWQPVGRVASGVDAPGEAGASQGGAVDGDPCANLCRVRRVRAVAALVMEGRRDAWHGGLGVGLQLPPELAAGVSRPLARPWWRGGDGRCSKPFRRL